MKIIYKYLIAVLISSCTLVPSREYIGSDNLDQNISKEELVGIYEITNHALKKLRNHYPESEIKKFEKSRIEIYSNGDSIKVVNIPVNLEMSGNYQVTTTTDRIDYRITNEKFWHLHRHDNYFPEMTFRIRYWQKSILINLDHDPDSWDYYEYDKY
jgi:hypothetical protein